MILIPGSCTQRHNATFLHQLHIEEDNDPIFGIGQNGTRPSVMIYHSQRKRLVGFKKLATIKDGWNFSHWANFRRVFVLLNMQKYCWKDLIDYLHITSNSCFFAVKVMIYWRKLNNTVIDNWIRNFTGGGGQGDDKNISRGWGTLEILKNLGVQGVYAYQFLRRRGGL